MQKSKWDFLSLTHVLKCLFPSSELVCLKFSAHWVQNFRMLKNKYDLTLWQSRLHTAAETFVRHKKVGKDFLRFRICSISF